MATWVPLIRTSAIGISTILITLLVARIGSHRVLVAKTFWSTMGEHTIKLLLNLETCAYVVAGEAQILERARVNTSLAKALACTWPRLKALPKRSTYCFSLPACGDV